MHPRQAIALQLLETQDISPRPSESEGLHKESQRLQGALTLVSKHVSEAKFRNQCQSAVTTEKCRDPKEIEFRQDDALLTPRRVRRWGDELEGNTCRRYGIVHVAR